MLGLPDDVIVSAGWLKENLGRCVVLEATWRKKEKEYLCGHITTAIHIDTDFLETPEPMWYLSPTLEDAIKTHCGLCGEELVCVYSKENICAARVWWMLMYAGVRDVRFLSGGLCAWKAIGGMVEIADNRPKEAVSFLPWCNRSWMLASMEDVKAYQLHPGKLIVDVRSRAEFDGLISGYDYVEGA